MQCEAFKGCNGGGPPKKKSKPFNEDQIKAALNESSEDSDDDVNANEKFFKSERNQNKVELEQKETDMTKEGENREETINDTSDENSKESKEN